MVAKFDVETETLVELKKSLEDLESSIQVLVKKIAKLESDDIEETQEMATCATKLFNLTKNIENRIRATLLKEYEPIKLKNAADYKNKIKEN